MRKDGVERLVFILDKRNSMCKSEVVWKNIVFSDGFLMVLDEGVGKSRG